MSQKITITLHQTKITEKPHLLKDGRLFGLDVMRAVAILAVLYTHIGVFLIHPLPLRVDGVGLFFVLSGYLIGGILLTLLNKPVFTFKHLLEFWIRRWMRTLPAYYFVLTFLVIFTNPAWRLWRPNPLTIWEYYFFVQTMFKGWILFFPESWSLTVEEWFYLLVPTIFFLSLKSKFSVKRLVLFWMVFLLVLGFFLKIFIYFTVNLVSEKSFDENFRKPTFLRLDSIMFGVLAAYIKYYKSLLWQHLKGKLFLLSGLLCLTTGVLIFFLEPYFEMRLIGFIALYLNTIGALLILPALSNIKSGKGFIGSVIRFISKISYSIYLINLNAFPVVWVYINILHHRIAGHFHISKNIFLGKHYNYYYHNCWFFIFSIGGGFILYSLVEKPFMHLRDKIKLTS